jgi:hypothetical protein
MIKATSKKSVNNEIKIINASSSDVDTVEHSYVFPWKYLWPKYGNVLSISVLNLFYAIVRKAELCTHTYIQLQIKVLFYKIINVTVINIFKGKHSCVLQYPHLKRMHL